MSPNSLLKEDFFKNFKSSSEITHFLEQFYKLGIEQILENRHRLESDATSSIDLSSSSKVSDSGVDFKSMQKRKMELEKAIQVYYSRGMDSNSIHRQIEDLYGFDLSISTISHITDSFDRGLLSCHTRPLESTYLVVWIDDFMFKVKEDGLLVNKTVYMGIGLRSDGKRDILGFWISSIADVSFWESVFRDISTRGVKDILISVTDQLAGFKSVFSSFYKGSTLHIETIHQLRNSCRYVIWRDKKELSQDIKDIYTSIDLELGRVEFDRFRLKWSSKYSYIVKSWEENWESLEMFFSLPVEIRSIIYTTDLLEHFERSVKKYHTSRLSYYSNDDLLGKAVYLSLIESVDKWAQLIRNWGLILDEFLAVFEGRIKI